MPSPEKGGGPTAPSSRVNSRSSFEFDRCYDLDYILRQIVYLRTHTALLL
jgi:hypothetical protein